MGGNGWQFSVTIPSWTQATLEGDENVVVRSSACTGQSCRFSACKVCARCFVTAEYAFMLPQFYRVEVKVLPPEADAAPRTRSVLRRFSHFTKLWAKVSQ